MLIKEKGITIVALVITIIILLILAGVTIRYSASDKMDYFKKQKLQEKNIKNRKNKNNLH